MEETISYTDLLSSISGYENHLLMGNGFNIGMGMNLSYQDIFNQMAKDSSNLYNSIDGIASSNGYDLEYVIGHLVSEINNPFLKEFISVKFKEDFMKAVQFIVKNNVRKVYDKNNYGIFLLFKEFDNFFTINYDSFNYLLLLKYKKSNITSGISIPLDNSQMVLDINEEFEDIYSKCREIIYNGTSILDINSKIVNAHRLKNAKVEEQLQVIKGYSEDNGLKWRIKDIRRVLNIIKEELKDEETLVIEQVELGFENSVFSPDTEQNVYHLHGAFHIYEEDGTTKVLRSTGIKSLYNLIEEALEQGDKNIVSVFERDNKVMKINENEYLKHCFNKLKYLSGNLVLIGVSCTENDDHIMNEIRKSNIKKLYISFWSKEDYENIERVKEKYFKDKSVVPVDAKSIKYDFDSDYDLVN